jgi:hypothetical protein
MGKWEFEIDFDRLILVAQRGHPPERKVLVWDDMSVLLAGLNCIEEMAILCSWQLNEKDIKLD